MRWPWSGKDDDQQRSGFAAWVAPLSSENWASTWTEPRILIPSIGLTVTTVAGVRFYKSFLRRIPTVNHIKPDYFRRRSLFGRVTSVGDADNFRLFHTPGGRLAGWGWLPWKSVPKKREELSKQTVSNIMNILCIFFRVHVSLWISSNISCRSTYVLLALMPQSLRIGAEKHSRIQKKHSNGSQT